MYMQVYAEARGKHQFCGSTIFCFVLLKQIATLNLELRQWPAGPREAPGTALQLCCNYGPGHAQVFVRVLEI